MTKKVVILLAEDDLGHASLVQKNLKRSGIINTIQHFNEGEKCLDFLFQRGQGPKRQAYTPYILLLDIRMPKVDGIEVLRRIKKDKNLSIMPVIMLTTTEDPKEIERCFRFGCSSYITKPVDSDKFVETIKRLGLFLAVAEFPIIINEK